MHRDLKPENILVKTASCPPMPYIFKICDFGLCILKEKECGSCGTEGWQAPEVENSKVGEFYTNKCDIFALGLILLKLLNGTNPFRNKKNNN